MSLNDTAGGAGHQDPDQAELRRLQDEIAQLQRERDEARAKSRRPPGSGGRVARWVVTIVLLVLTAVLALATVPALFLRSQIFDTDRYVATVAPLASDPAIQAEITEKVTNQITEAVDIEGITGDALTELSASVPRVAPQITGLAPVIADQTTDLIQSTIAGYVAAPQFQDLWNRANRAAHQALDNAASGTTDSVVSIDDSGNVTISTKEIIADVKTNLTQRGVAIADKIPDVGGEITVAQVPELATALEAIRILDRAAPLLAWLTVLCAVCAVAVAPPGARRRATGLAGLAISAGMALLAIGLVIGRAFYLEAIPPDALSPAAAQSLIDTLLDPLRITLRLVFVVGLLIALAAFLTGGSPAARSIRRAFGRAGDYLAGKAGATEAKPWQRSLARYRRAVEAVLVGIAALVLILWQYPTTAVAIWTAVITVLLILVVELLCRPATAPRHTSGTIPDTAPDTASDTVSDTPPDPAQPRLR